jgi:hypothetical protein
MAVLRVGVMVAGWAVKVGEDIDVRTISPTRRAAIVNFLHCNIQPILNSFPDATIERIWDGTKDRFGLEVVEVTIIEGRPP